MATNKKPEDLLNEYKQQWEAANAAGNEAGKQAAHDAATALRQQMDKQNGTTSTYNPGQRDVDHYAVRRGHVLWQFQRQRHDGAQHQRVPV